MTNIFDTKNIKDLPEDFKENLKLLNLRDGTKKVLKLFEEKSPLSVDEILVALKRKYNMDKTRIWVCSTLYSLSNKKLIKRLQGLQGYYEKI